MHYIITYVKQEKGNDDVSAHHQDFAEKYNKVSDSVDGNHSQYVAKKCVKRLHSCHAEICRTDR